MRYNAGLQLPPSGRALETTREFELLPVWVLTPTGEHGRVQIEPSHVNVKISGNSALVQTMRPEELRAFVQLQSEQPPAGAFAVEVVAPRGITVVGIAPSGVTLRPVESL